MPLKRSPQWERDYHNFLIARAKTPFVWGQNDCCLFPADAIQAFTGVDPAADFRGKYSTEAEALALIHSVTGGSTVEDAAAWCAQKHGLVEWTRNGAPSPLFAQRGDLVVLNDDGNLIAGVVHLKGTHAVTVGAEGLKLLSIRAIKRAWRV